ncbi:MULTISPECIES: hypothetical protein [unclassified Kitasatospora]|uniref:hypothetical protein n=1 Tax=unclassified Kitasatospora TaxID=2633591 RepID=UPI00070ECD42|nr:MULTISPECIES: hypothetical protein [unclassified Kitasatospora]KRB73642.1 hypothetical protein ASE03_20775 [Kitasatospora sp. Root187]
MQRIDINDVAIDIDEEERLFYDGGPFTGEVLAWHENGRVESRKLYSASGKKLASYAWDEDGRQTRDWTASVK